MVVSKYCTLQTDVVFLFTEEHDVDVKVRHGYIRHALLVEVGPHVSATDTCLFIEY